MTDVSNQRVGLGDQGGPMALAIVEAGFLLHAWARRPAMACSRLPSISGTGVVVCALR
jgi:3-hydroxyisobutyrate dehydrogenase-like beta-hydroxyacid dehydrogenase